MTKHPHMNKNKAFCALLMAALFPLCVSAQDKGNMEITAIDWETLKIDSVPPVYTEVVPLETDYRLYDYSVKIEYPEYISLTKEETEMVVLYDSLIHEDIEVDTHVGVQRGKGMLDISFLPVVRRNGSYLKLKSAQISIASSPRSVAKVRSAKAADRYVAHSVLQTGRWVKVSITSDGMYRLTRKALKKMGFSNPDKVHLYGHGGHLMNEVLPSNGNFDDLEEVPLYYSQDQDCWLFWGNGLVYMKDGKRVLNHYANHAYYFLHEEDETSSIATEDNTAKQSVNVYDTYTAYTLHENDQYAWFHAGRKLVEEYDFQNGAKTFKLSTPDIVNSTAKVTINFTAYSKVDVEFVPTINGEEQSPLEVLKAQTYEYAAYDEATYSFPSPGNTTEWTVRLPKTSVPARLDYILIQYERKLKPADGYVSFSRNSSGVTRFDIEGTDLCVMRKGTPGSPATLVKGTNNAGTYQVTVDDATADYVAFQPSYSFPEPTYVSEVANQDLHAIDSVDMVIITPASGKLQAQAQRLADAHLQYDSITTAIVRADEIYNEFSSGTPDATAYRTFLKMLYDKAGTDGKAPKYLLLMGDCAWDNRMLSSAWSKTDPDTYLLCYSSEESFSDTKSYCMEDYFGLLDDGEGSTLLREKSDLGIGRFPVTNDTDAKVMVDKSITYMSNGNAGPWKNYIYFLGDDGDNNEHMKYADDVAERVKSQYPELEVHKVMWDSYPRVTTAKSNTYPQASADIKKVMEDGAMVMNYTGHSASYGLSHEFVLLVEDFQNTKSRNLPLWVTCSCDAMPFDGQGDNIGETAVLNAEGGALAFYGTARTVYASQNKKMNQYLMNYLFAQDSDGNRLRLGDAIRLTKNSIISDNTESLYRENKLQYALLGDPAVVIGNPLHKLVIDSIDGNKVSSSERVQLKAGQKTRISGHVNSPSGTLAPDFNGTVKIRLFDSEETIVCNNNDDAKTVFEYKDRTNLLLDIQDSLTSGTFQADFVMPVDINFSDKSGKFFLYGINNEGTTEANGSNDGAVIGGVVDNLDFDSDGPTIVAYLNDETFQNGDVVNSTPFFVAQLQDESGINSSGSGIGHDLTLCVDGRSDMTYNLNDYYVREFGDFTRGSVSFSIPKLEEGTHSLTFRAWDVLNHTNTTSLDFVVDPTVKPEMVSLTASCNPATESTTFLVSHDMKGSECKYTLEVFDFTGRCVWSKTDVASSDDAVISIPWNLTNGNGAKQGSGVYLYRCTMSSDQSRNVSKTEKLIILNNK